MLLIAAAGLRSYRLGDWCLASDEVATRYETASLFTGEGDPKSVYTRLPRLIPLGYVPLRWSHHFFGEATWVGRLAPAAFGALTVALVYLLVAGSLGSWTGFFVAATVCLLPDHLFQSQYERFYATAGLLGWTSLALGGWALSRRCAVATAVAVLLGLAAVLAHAVWAVAVGAVLLAFIAARFADRTAVSRLMLLMVGAGTALAAAWIGLRVYADAATLNEGATWGYSSARAVLAAISQLGWPIALLAILGLLTAARRRSLLDGYWLVLALVNGLAIVALPRLMVYNPHYGLLLLLPWIVLAAMGMEAVRAGLRSTNRATAWAWTVAVLLFPIPGVVSYYADGSRFNYAPAADFLRRQLDTGDRVACDAPGVLHQCLGTVIPTVPLPPGTRVAELDRLSTGPGRTWVVLASGRAGLPADVQTWLDLNARRVLHTEAPRLDYYRFCVDLYRLEPRAAGERG